MYRIIKIGGKDYKLEYSIEASLYSECAEKITELMVKIEESGDIKHVLSGISNIPQTTLTVFYAGLMEHHGNHSEGDGTVPDIQSAKRLIAQYIREHSGDDTGNFFGVMNICVEQMGEDGFFDLIGLSSMSAKAEEEKQLPKIPQDHRSKQNKQKMNNQKAKKEKASVK